MLESSLVYLQDQVFLDKQRIAGLTVGKILSHLNSLVQDGLVKSPKDLEAETDRILADNHCQPTFKGYKGFPSSVCISVNKNLVHGIPSNIPFVEGDVVKFDLGATYQSAIADAAGTAIFNQKNHTPNSKHVSMIETCRESLNKGIQAIAVGKQIGVIGQAIHKYVTGSSPYGLVCHYGGHSVAEPNVPHGAPFIPNKSRPTDGVRIQPGMALAIEPMVVIGDATRTKVLADGWTVLADGICAHFEHSIFVHEDRVEILTAW